MVGWYNAAEHLRRRFLRVRRDPEGARLLDERPVFDPNHADMEALERLPSVEKVVPVVMGQARVEGNRRGRSVFVYGVTSDVPDVWKFDVLQGSFLPGLVGVGDVADEHQLVHLPVVIGHHLGELGQRLAELLLESQRGPLHHDPSLR